SLISYPLCKVWASVHLMPTTWCRATGWQTYRRKRTPVAIRPMAWDPAGVREAVALIPAEGRVLGRVAAAPPGAVAALAGAPAPDVWAMVLAHCATSRPTAVASESMAMPSRQRAP